MHNTRTRAWNPNFLVKPDPNPTRSQKALLVRPWLWLMCGLVICVLWLIGYNILTSFCGEVKSTFFSIRMNGRKTMWRCNLLTIRQIGLCLAKKFTYLNERRESEHNGKQKENRGRKSQQEIKDGVELPEDGGALKFLERLTVHL